MAVDREGRDELASEIASLMRGDMTIPAFAEQARNYDPQERIDLLLDTCQSQIIHTLNRGNDRLRIESYEWNCFERWLIILKSNIDRGNRDMTEIKKDNNRTGGVKVYRLILCILAILLSLAGFIFWGFAGIFVYVFVAIFVIATIIWIELRTEKRPSYCERLYYPFTNKEEWQGCRDQLKVFKLPDYEPTLHGLSPRDMFKELATAITVVASFATLAGALWPIMLFGWAGLLPKRPRAKTQRFALLTNNLKRN